jgi:hypothetical protein
MDAPLATASVDNDRGTAVMMVVVMMMMMADDDPMVVVVMMSHLDRDLGGLYARRLAPPRIVGLERFHRIRNRLQ